MADVNRFEFYCDGFDNCEIRLSKTGDLVGYEDHKKIVDELEKEIKRLKSRPNRGSMTIWKGM